MKTNQSFRGIAWWVGAAAATTLGVVACGSDFSSGDCKINRTCPAAGGDSAADGGAPSSAVPNAGGADIATAAGQPAGGSSDETVQGAASGAGGAGGAAGQATTANAGGAGGAPEPECRVAKDCSNNDPTDGEELCKNGSCAAGNPPPKVVSVTPIDKATGVAPDGSIVITFNEPLDPKTVTNDSIQVLDGDTAVPTAAPTYTDGKVTLKPTAPLSLITPYSVSVSSKVTDADGAALLTPFKSTFTVRDGTWTTIDAVKDRLHALSDALPISSAGEVLVAWSGTGGDYCPVSARWFLRGSPSAPSKAFPVVDQGDSCYWLTSGGNAAGVVALAWNDTATGSDIEQFRGAAWQATPALVSANIFATRFRLAVAPSGAATFFEPAGLAYNAWTSDSAGKWPTSGDLISSFEAQGRTQVAFDANGNGLAVWAAKDPVGSKLQRIVASRFTSASGKWAVATDLPGSVAAATSTLLQRGTPAIAVDNQGDALALWVDAAIGAKLMASRYTQATGWAAPESISGSLLVEPLQDAPGLVFDGQAYVAAWTAQDAGERYAYTARYDLKTGWTTYHKQQTAAADTQSAARMPRLASAGRGNSLLVFATGSGPTFNLMYQRYTAGAWSAPKALDDGTITNENFETDDILPMSMSVNGLAALAWTNRDDQGYITGVRLASFY